MLPNIFNIGSAIAEELISGSKHAQNAREKSEDEESEPEPKEKTILQIAKDVLKDKNLSSFSELLIGTRLVRYSNAGNFDLIQPNRFELAL